MLTVIRFFLQEKSCKRITRLYIFRMVLLWEVISCLQYPDESYFIKGSSKTNECILKTAISKTLSKCKDTKTLVLANFINGIRYFRSGKRIS